MKAITILSTAVLLSTTSALTARKNATYYNPIIPGFHPDPSCIFVKEMDNTFFCASSSFISFPAMPIHASKDLVNWKLIGHVQNRPEQYPPAGNISRNSGGWYAPTLRYHDSTFYVINADVSAPQSGIFTTKNIYNDAAWSHLLPVDIGGYDADIFFDQDGTIYSQAAITVSNSPFATEIQQFTISLPSGATTPRYFLTNGTGVQPPEGPHLYYKDDYYWLLLAQGGTALQHQVTFFRSKSPQGPWESDPANPIQTAINTTSLFQSVGHADIFQDANGNYWGVALTTRSGPEDQWPVADRVHGIMSGPLPPRNLNVPGIGAFVKDPDHYTFEPGSELPLHFTFWRFPHKKNYAISPKDYPNTLRLRPSNANLTAGFADFIPSSGQTFVGRRQVDTLFVYNIDMSFNPKRTEEEAGVTIFLRQEANAELGVVHLNGSAYLRFRGHGFYTVLPEVITPLSNALLEKGIHFQIQAINFTHYTMSYGPKGSGNAKLTQVALIDNSIFSISFTGVFVGIYATTNDNGEGGTPAYFSNWKYQGQGQAIGDGQYYPSNGQKGPVKPVGE